MDLFDGIGIEKKNEKNIFISDVELKKKDIPRNREPL
jgi:hypothetical protein